MSSTDGSHVVRVSQKGQTTIPKEFRERHGIDAPGRVRFRETDDGEIVVEAVPHPTEKLGARADRVHEGEVDAIRQQLRADDLERERRAIDRHRSDE